MADISSMMVEIGFRSGRAEAIAQEAVARIRRARRRDRPAMMERAARRIADECVFLKAPK